MLIQYALDSYITAVLPYSLIVSRQLARFASPRASLRYLCGLRVGVYPEQSRRALYSSFSFSPKPNLDRPACARNSFPLNSFADPHPLTPVASIFYKKGGGVTTSRVAGPHSARFWCTLNPLDATLLSPLVCVANKGLAQYLSPLNATLTKNTGGRGSSYC